MHYCYWMLFNITNTIDGGRISKCSILASAVNMLLTMPLTIRFSNRMCIMQTIVVALILSNQSGEFQELVSLFLHSFYCHYD